jgi:hypothetical protein
LLAEALSFLAAALSPAVIGLEEDVSAIMLERTGLIFGDAVWPQGTLVELEDPPRRGVPGADGLPDNAGCGRLLNAAPGVNIPSSSKLALASGVAGVDGDRNWDAALERGVRASRGVGEARNPSSSI